MLLSILVAYCFTLVVPCILLWALWQRPEPNRFRWLLKVVYTGGFLLYAFLVGRWDWVGYYLRYVMLAVFVLVAIASYRMVPARPFTEESGSRWRPNVGSLVTIAFVAALIAWTMSGYVYTEVPVRLALPLVDGWFYVAQGGNSTIVNYHNGVEGQQYAVDIVALNAFGTRARGIYPKSLERYVIYGAPVHSPCDGTVAAVVDDLPDQIPPAGDRENAAGNHVVIGCDGANVLLAHLRAGSLAVNVGESVITGRLLGEVGNSGNTSEPHLHIHALRAGSDDPLSGESVPMLFDGTFAVRNATFF